MSGFEPIFAWRVCLGLAILAAGAALLSGFLLRRSLRLTELGLLLALRLLVILFLLALLTQPFRERRRPDPDQFQVVLLADASASMNTQDCGERSRLSVLQKALAAEGDRNSWLGQISRTYRSRTYLFSEELVPYYGQRFDSLPGNTALGNALRDAVEQQVSPPVGAVVILSDGNGNAGVAVEDAAKVLQTKGIPVSCIGIGESGEGADGSAYFITERMSGVKGQPLSLRVGVRSSQGRAAPGELVLSLGRQEVARRAVVLPERNHETTVDFSLTPDRAGFQTATVQLRSSQPDSNPANNVDYAALQISEPPKFRVLYLGASLNWEYKFVQLAVAGSEQIILTAVIQTGDGRFFATGFPGEGKTEPGFPRSLAELAAFDGLVVETRVLPLLPPDTASALTDFVAGRGGGLLCIGPLEPVPPALHKLLPVVPGESRPVKAKAALEASPSLVFDRDQSGVVTAPPGLYLPPTEPVWLGFQLKKSARPVIWLADPPAGAVMAVQAYGSGRVAYSGLENSWRWRLSSQAGTERHAAYWQSLLSWLSSTAKPRLAAPCHGRKVELGSPLDLALDVTSAGFLPATEANVTATVVTPDARTIQLACQASGEKRGRYSERFTPEMPGEYRVTYEVVLPGETLQQEARFLARSAGGERQNPEFQEKRLRDVARITGGEYWSWHDLTTAPPIPVSARIPHSVERRRWTESLLFLTGLVTALATDWFVRRRLGLK